MNNKIFITSTLPYSNSVDVNKCGAHIGHLFEFVLTDALAKFYRTRYDKENVFFNTGLDEEGLKIYETANGFGLPTQEFLDKQAIFWKEFCVQFQIDYDNFYRTSSQQHQIHVQNFWNKSVEHGDIYKKKYQGLYCSGCESFKTNSDLENGKCPDHPNLELQSTEEENYFFRLSNYKNDLLNWIKTSPDFLTPSKKYQELVNIIEAIEDISVSRQRSVVPWGVPVPDDDSQTIYVWYSALLNYIFSAGYNPKCDEKSLTEFNENGWKDTLQTCGSDNLRFQAVIFQGLLMSAGIKPTHRLLVHGTILDANGKKMSKTVGNVIDPIDQLEKYGLDAVRYYALAGLNLCENSGWDEKRLVETFNSHLADDYGNLLARTLHLVDISNIKIDYELINKGLFFDTVTKLVAKIKSLWEELKINEALNETNELVKEGNRKMNAEEPWSKNVSKDKATLCLMELHFLLSEVSKLYYPVIPAKSKEAQKALLENKKVILFKKIEKKYC